MRNDVVEGRRRAPALAFADPSGKLFDIARHRSRELGEGRDVPVASRDDLLEREVDRAGEQDDVSLQLRRPGGGPKGRDRRDQRDEKCRRRKERHEPGLGAERQSGLPSHDIGGCAQQHYAGPGDGQSKHV